MCVEIRK